MFAANRCFEMPWGTQTAAVEEIESGKGYANDTHIEVIL